MRPNAGPVWVAPFTYRLSDQTVRVRERGERGDEGSVAERAGLGRFMKFTTATANASHPLGGCRMADSKDLGVVDHRNEVFGNEGLFCIDSSAIPTSLGVNPSLTISAVSERAVRAAGQARRRLGLPASRPGSRRASRACILGPAHRAGAAPLGHDVDAKVRSYG